MYELTYSYFPTTKMDSETYSNHSDLCGEDACHYLCTFLSEKLIHIKVRKYLTNSLASLCKQKETNICSDELIIYSALLHHSLCAVCYCVIEFYIYIVVFLKANEEVRPNMNFVVTKLSFLLPIDVC